MPQLLIELLSEEIPARMQAGAARDLARMYGERLAAAGLAPGSLRTYAGPRRLTLVAEELPAATPDRTEELKGPKASAPPQALEGFLRKTGLGREDLTERDGVLYATRATPGRPTPQIAAEALGEVMRAFPWPKSMRSGVSAFRWVRPLKSVLFLFDGVVVLFEIDGITAGDETRGHRFMGALRGAPFRVEDFDDYRVKLEHEFVELDAADRRARILDQSRALCAAQGLELVEDEGLLDEVAGLAEWPTPVLGAMDPAFLDLPPEVIRTSMRTHQKYFAVRRPGGEGLAPRFVVVANVEASDGGAALAAGNARVLSARLSDARFFWNEDRREGAFERWLAKLEGVTFHAKLGSMAERVARIEALAREIAPLLGADPELAARAARLAKADLASAMVGEFPELQGIMGGYYAREMLRAQPSPSPLRGGGRGGGGADATASVAVDTPLTLPSPPQGERGFSDADVDAIADAVRDHYKPVGPSDSVPTAPVTVAVALADKLDTLVGFFAIDERPTGSKDPYALRRAALGIVRLLLVNGLPLSLPKLLSLARRPFFQTALAEAELSGPTRELFAFMQERSRVGLRERGYAADVVEAAFGKSADNIVRLGKLVEALSDFLVSEDGANLLAGYTRATNILRAEEKKGAPLPASDEAPAERDDAPPEQVALQQALRTALSQVQPRVQAEDFAGAMAALAALRQPVDAFFDRVLVNDPDLEVRLDRLRLLNQVREAADQVADFSRIQG